MTQSETKRSSSSGTPHHLQMLISSKSMPEQKPLLSPLDPKHLGTKASEEYGEKKFRLLSQNLW